jgi:hypothetical protein
MKNSKSTFEVAFAEYEKSLVLARGFAGFVIDTEVFSVIDEAIATLEAGDENTASYKVRGVSMKLRNLLSGFFRGSIRHFVAEISKSGITDPELIEKLEASIKELEVFMPPVNHFVNLEEAVKVYSKVHEAFAEAKVEQERRLEDNRVLSARKRIEDFKAKAEKARLASKERADNFRARAHSLAGIDSVVCSGRSVQ